MSANLTDAVEEYIQNKNKYGKPYTLYENRYIIHTINIILKQIRIKTQYSLIRATLLLDSSSKSSSHIIARYVRWQMTHCIRVRSIPPKQSNFKSIFNCYYLQECRYVGIRYKKF